MTIRGGDGQDKSQKNKKKDHPGSTQKEEEKDYSKGFGNKVVSFSDSSFLLFVLQAHTHPLCSGLYKQH